FDQACLEAYEEGSISDETALLYCTKRSVVSRGLDNSRKSRGEMDSSAGLLRMKIGGAGGKAGPSEGAPLLKIK
ncbi:MAG: twitching motility protein, partial [Verrucomicrobiota bacterium]